MANWSTLKAAIAQIIKTNNNQEITGANMQSVLNNIIDNVGENATYAGIATPSTNPGAPDGNVFYFATQAGIYANFGGAELKTGLNILLWKGTSWAVTNVINFSELVVNLLPFNTTTRKFNIFYKKIEAGEKFYFTFKNDINIGVINSEVFYSDGSSDYSVQFTINNNKNKQSKIYTASKDIVKIHLGNNNYNTENVDFEIKLYSGDLFNQQMLSFCEFKNLIIQDTSNIENISLIKKLEVYAKEGYFTNEPILSGVGFSSNNNRMNFVINDGEEIKYIYIGNSDIEGIEELCYKDENICVKITADWSKIKYTDGNINAKLIYYDISKVFSTTDSFLPLFSFVRPNNNNDYEFYKSIINFEIFIKDELFSLYKSFYLDGLKRRDDNGRLYVFLLYGVSADNESHFIDEYSILAEMPDDVLEYKNVISNSDNFIFNAKINWNNIKNNTILKNYNVPIIPQKLSNYSYNTGCLFYKGNNLANLKKLRAIKDFTLFVNREKYSDDTKFSITFLGWSDNNRYNNIFITYDGQEIYLYPSREKPSGIKRIKYANTDFIIDATIDYNELVAGACDLGVSYTFDIKNNTNSIIDTAQNYLPNCIISSGTVLSLLNRKLVAWIDDDASEADIPKVKAICDARNIKCTFATNGSPDGTKLELLKQYQQEGFDIVSHSYTHNNYWYTGGTYDIKKIREDVYNTYTAMNTLGFCPEILVYPGSGGIYEDTHIVVSRYFNFGILAGPNSTKIDLFSSGKYGIPRHFLKVNDGIEDFKKYVANCETLHTPIILGTHSATAEWNDEWDTEFVENCIDYLIENGYTFLTATELCKTVEPIFNFVSLFNSNI